MDGSTIANGSQDPQTLAGLFSSSCAENIRSAADREEVIATAGADFRRIQVNNKVEAAKRHDKELHRLIESFVDAYPFYDPIEYWF